jgi:predicted 2-oxoglutarate/Fe(II)-dependent dioxygenase YbiX
VLDFYGAFFTFAIKEGTSEIFHVDWNDDLDSITWLIPLGDWEGGELVLPQKGIECRIPIRPGDVFGFMARTLVHCTTPVTKGRRVILTCFSDSNILRHGRFKLFFRSARLL